MKKKAIIRNVIIFIAVCVVLIGAFSIGSLIEKKDDNNKETSEDLLYYKYHDEYYKQKSNLQVVLCVGLDSYDNQINKDSYVNEELADCIVLLVLDKNNKTILPIQINRDTMCNFHVLGIGGKITNDDFGQIALSHMYGTGDIDSLVNVKNAVSDLMCGIRIDNYVSLTMEAVGIINDKAGGIKVLVEDDFSGIDETLIKGQEVTLLGKQALTFVRSRQGMDDPSNINRLNRQRVYLRSLYETCKNKVNNDKEFVSRVLESVSDYLIANTNIYGLGDLGNTLLEYELKDAVKLDGSVVVNDYVEFYPDKDKLESFCIDTFYTKVK